MESIIDRLSEQQTWEEFLTYRLLKGRFNWYEFDEADTYVSEAQYRDVVEGCSAASPCRCLPAIWSTRWAAERSVWSTVSRPKR